MARKWGVSQNLAFVSPKEIFPPSFDPLSGGKHFSMAVRLWVFLSSALFWSSITLILSNLLMKEDLKTVGTIP